jgi:hypothetical protein
MCTFQHTHTHTHTMASLSIQSINHYINLRLWFERTSQKLQFSIRHVWGYVRAQAARAQFHRYTDTVQGDSAECNWRPTLSCSRDQTGMHCDQHSDWSSGESWHGCTRQHENMSHLYSSAVTSGLLCHTQFYLLCFVFASSLKPVAVTKHNAMINGCDGKVKSSAVFIQTNST